MENFELPLKIINNGKFCLIGVSHLYDNIDSLILEALNKFNPKILLLELDQTRFNSLSEVVKSGIEENKELTEEFILKKLGFSDNKTEIQDDESNSTKSILNDEKKDTLNNSLEPNEESQGMKFKNIIHDIQWQLGKKKGLIPGFEFFTAIKYAYNNNVKIHLIDVSIDNITDQIDKLDPKALNSFITEEFGDIKEPKNMGMLNTATLGKIEDEFNEFIPQLKDENVLMEIVNEIAEKHPEIYDILIGQRDRNMAIKIQKILQKHPNEKILAIIGAGHYLGILKILNH